MSEGVNESTGAIIARKRREHGLTRELFAGELGVGFLLRFMPETERSFTDERECEREHGRDHRP